MTDEGFVDKIDMLANKMGVNLDRDPEQVESIANEEEREFYTDRPYNPDEPANDGSYPKCKSCHGWGYNEITHLGIMEKCGSCGGTGKLFQRESLATESNWWDEADIEERKSNLDKWGKSHSYATYKWLQLPYDVILAVHSDSYSNAEV